MNLRIARKRKGKKKKTHKFSVINVPQKPFTRYTLKLNGTYACDIVM